MQFSTLDLKTAKELYDNLLQQFSLQPSDRMNDETKARFKRLHLNLAAFIAYMEEGIESLPSRMCMKSSKLQDSKFE